MIWHRHHSSSWDIAGGNNKPVSLAHVKEFSAWGVKLHRLPCGSAYAWTVIIAITLIIKMPERREWRGSRGRKRQKSDGRWAGTVGGGGRQAGGCVSYSRCPGSTSDVVGAAATWTCTNRRHKSFEGGWWLCACLRSRFEPWYPRAV